MPVPARCYPTPEDGCPILRLRSGEGWASTNPILADCAHPALRHPERSVLQRSRKPALSEDRDSDRSRMGTCFCFSPSPQVGVCSFQGTRRICVCTRRSVGTALFPGAGQRGATRTKCSALCDREPAKWSLKASRKIPNGRLKFRESSSGAPGNFPYAGQMVARNFTFRG